MMETHTEEKIVDLKKLSKEELVAVEERLTQKGIGMYSGMDHYEEIRCPNCNQKWEDREKMTFFDFLKVLSLTNKWIKCAKCGKEFFYIGDRTILERGGQDYARIKIPFQGSYTLPLRSEAAES